MSKVESDGKSGFRYMTLTPALRRLRCIDSQDLEKRTEFELDILKIFLFTCVYVHVHEFTCTMCEEGQRVLDHLEPELQVLVSHQLFSLETEPRASGRAVSALHHRIIPKTSELDIFNLSEI